MRRAAIVGPAPSAEQWAAWLEQSPAVSARAAQSLEAVALDATDVLWLQDRTDITALQLVAWLESGGRLLLTGDAVDASSAKLVQFDAAGPEAPVGLAALGAHPLFAGSDHGARLAARRGTWRLATAPLERAETVGAAWFAGRLDPAFPAAWEWPVGQGGVLCLGAPIGDLPPAEPLDILLRNALLGDAIPHRDRGAVGHWPPPGTGAERDPAHPVPRVSAAAGVWRGEADVGAVPSNWRASGRRMILHGGSDGQLAEVRSPPGSFLRDIAVQVNGAVPVATDGSAGPDGITRGLNSADGKSIERWCVDPEFPLAVWDLHSMLDVDVTGAATVEFRSPGVAAGSLGNLRFNLSEGGRRLWVGTDAGPQCLLAAEQATLAAQPLDGDRLRVSWSGRGGFRMLIAAGTGDADLARTLGHFERRGLAGVQSRRVQHAKLIREYGAQVSTPDAAFDTEFAGAKHRAEATLIEFPRLGRAPAQPDGTCDVAAAVSVAEGLLAAGLRDAAHDLLALLSLTQRRDGAIARTVLPIGVVEYGGSDSANRFLQLAAAYLAWTGESERLARFSDALARARDYAAAIASGGGPAAAERTESPAVVDAAILMRGVVGLWGAAPAPAASGLTLRPALPEGWDRAALRRLRIGRAVLELAFRRRLGRISVRVSRVQGPALPISVELGGPPPSLMAVDDVDLPGQRAVFEANGQHEVTFQW